MNGVGQTIRMTNIIENDSDRASTESVRVGEGSSLVPIKFYQDVYHQVTGRTEQISRKYKDNLLLELADIQQLHHKIAQLLDVHNVVASNEVITIFYEKERKEQFTSFERFKLYNANATSPCLSLVLKFNLSIIPAGLKKPQEYVVTVKLTSRVGMLKQLANDDEPGFMRGYFLTRTSTAEITIEYADYVVARGFMEAFDEWINGARKSYRSNVFTFLQKKSHMFPEILRLIGAIFLTSFALSAVPSLLGDSTSVQTWARFLVIYIGGAYIILSLLELSGTLLERAIDNYPTLSYLNLNKGDANLIETFNAQRTPEVWRFIGGCVLTLILGIASSKLERFI